MQTHHFCILKLYCLITVISLIVKFLTQVSKFYCFRLGPYISFKYGWQSFTLMMGEAFLKAYSH